MDSPHYVQSPPFSSANKLDPTLAMWQWSCMIIVACLSNKKVARASNKNSAHIAQLYHWPLWLVQEFGTASTGKVPQRIWNIWKLIGTLWNRDPIGTKNRDPKNRIILVRFTFTWPDHLYVLTLGVSIAPPAYQVYCAWGLRSPTPAEMWRHPHIF